MANKNELAVMDTRELQVVPTADNLAAIMGELQDMGTLPFGRVQIAAAGAGVFRVTEPGEDEPVVATEIVAVIIAHHLTNVLWLNKYGTVEDRTPDCVSFDGKEGTARETGEIRRCEHCEYNRFGSADGGAGRGKACKNTRRLYLMRLADGLHPGDVLPSILSLPSTALAAFDKYRTKLMLRNQTPYGVVTKLTLKNATNKDGIAYSTPVFEAVPGGTLPPEEVQRVKAYADGFMAAMKHSVYDEPLAAGPAASAPGSLPADDQDELPFM